MYGGSFGEGVVPVIVRTQRSTPVARSARLNDTHKTKYPYADMRVGDMFFLPDRETNNMAAYTSLVGKRLGRKFRTRFCYMRNTIEGWVACGESHPRARLGIGIWRIK
jgi:hypothetical protein